MIETENVLAYHHTDPVWPVYIVIITKYHEESFLTLLNRGDEMLSEMMLILKKVVQSVTQEYGGCRLTTNFGSCQETKHLHWHVHVGERMD